LLNAMEPTTFGWRDGERIPLPSNGSSMRFQRPSRTTTGNPTHSTSNLTVDPATSDVLTPTQDGGKCSSIKEQPLSTKRVR
jgi:hypothetical protein